MFKKLALLLLVAGLLFTAVLLAGTFRLTSKQVLAEPAADVRLDTMAAAQRLAQTLTFRTVSNEAASQVDTNAFLALHRKRLLLSPGVRHLVIPGTLLLLPGEVLPRHLIKRS